MEMKIKLICLLIVFALANADELAKKKQNPGKDKVGKSETPGKVSYMGSLEVPFSEVPRFCDVNESFRNLRKCSRSYNLSCKLGNGFPALCFRNNYRRVFECLAPSFFGSPVCCDYTC